MSKLYYNVIVIVFLVIGYFRCIIQLIFDAHSFVLSVFRKLKLLARKSISSIYF